MQSMREQMDQLFGDAFNRFESSDRFSDLFDMNIPASPRIDMRETSDAYEVTVEIPGADSSTIETALKEQILFISAEVNGQSKKSTEEDQSSMLRRERWVSRFERSIQLPQAVDGNAMSSEFKAGILSIHLPKK